MCAQNEVATMGLGWNLACHFLYVSQKHLNKCNDRSCTALVSKLCICNIAYLYF